MPEGGKQTPLSPSFVQRVVQGVRYAVSGVGPNTWFGPLQPLQPMAPAEVKGRQFDYPTGYNLNYTPRSSESVSFEELRALADNCDILRSVIETRKDQMEAQEWSIKIRPDDNNKRAKATPDQQKRISFITEFFQFPDKEHTWEQWQRMLLEDTFVIDAACVYKRRNRKGELYSLDIIDGASIKVLADGEGRRPVPPDPAYQQILKGIPAADFDSDELMYLVHNPRSHRFYGYGHVEQVLVTINILIRRSLHQLEYYREGSVPDAFLFAPADWNADTIKDFQAYLDGFLSGNSAQKRKLRILPESKYQETKPPVLKDEYDEFLARIVCFVFSLPPTAFVKQANRATAESAKEQAVEEGLAPIQNYMRKFMNRIIAVDFQSPDLVFDWQDTREMDPETASTIRVNEVKAGIISIDEAREEKGEDPLGGAYGVPMALTATGYVAILSPEDQQKAKSDQQQAASDAAAARMQPAVEHEKSESGTAPKKSPEPDNGAAQKSRFGGLKKKVQSVSPHDRPAAQAARKALKSLAEKVLAKTGKEVAKQLDSALGKIAKGSDDDRRDNGIVDSLDLAALGGLAASDSILDSIASDRGQDVLLSLGISDDTDSFSHANDRAAAYASDRSAELVTDIDESTRNMLRQKIAAGLASGAMREDIIADIMDGDIFSEDRATLIADTEVAMASGQGALAGYKEAKAAGVKLKKRWVCDSDPCPICEENQDAGPIDVDEVFPSDDESETAHPGCHCHTESVVEDDDDADE